MRFYLLLLTFIIMLFPACSGGGSDPIAPNPDNGMALSDESFITQDASDVLYAASSADILAYKAYGVYQVSIDPAALTGEIIPSRNASAIGLVFDADLTQFLTVTPCPNCLQINGIQLTADNKVNVGFAVKHPFADPSKRPDLHGFDVRGIVLAKGNFNFTTLVQMNASDTAPARANVDLVVNADGYTHHFDELASDIHYFDPPRNYDANINPYKRYFEDSSTGAFDFANPVGHNVIPCGSDWDVQVYSFNLAPGAETLDFGFIVDCAYGASATFQNRYNPYYFLPEFNRKEAWKVDTTIESNGLQSGSSASSATLKVEVCDWQAGLTADPNYPDTGNLGGISVTSGVALVSVEIPSVSSLTSVSVPDSGTGSGSDPYIYRPVVVNSGSAPAGSYWGIVAVRDQLQGQVGPLGIPESPAGFPFAGPEIYDYSTYSIFSIRVNGTAPDITNIVTPTGVHEEDVLTMNATVTEPDGDTVTYLWEQILPASPVGTFIDNSVKNAKFVVPSFYDIPPAGINFTLRLTASDADGQDTFNVVFNALEKNTAPACLGITTNPSNRVISAGGTMNLSASGFDAESDTLIYTWDLDFDGVTFNTDFTGQNITGYSWADQSYYMIACKVTEDRTNALSDMCIIHIIQEGLSNDDIQVDDASLSPLPNYSFPDVAIFNVPDGRPYFNVVYADQNNDEVWYANNSDNLYAFGHHTKLGDTLPTGWRSYSKIAENNDVLVATWIETEPTTVTTIKTRTSLDGGATWSTAVSAATATDPDYIGSLALSRGEAGGDFFIFFTKREGVNCKCYVVRTSNNGTSWSYPGAPSNGQFRDTPNTASIFTPMISVDKNEVIHAVWLDSTSNYHYYDYSTDNGNTWHTDIQITAPSVDGSMYADEDGNVHMTYMTANKIYYVETTYGAPPVVGTPILVASDIDTSSESCTVGSPDASVITTIWAYQSGTNHYIEYFYSFDQGHSWNSYVSDHGTTQVFWPACEGTGFGDAPSGSGIFNVWIDYRTSSWPEGHIFGEYMCLADRQ